MSRTAAERRGRDGIRLAGTLRTAIALLLVVATLAVAAVTALTAEASLTAPALERSHSSVRSRSGTGSTPATGLSAPPRPRGHRGGAPAGIIESFTLLTAELIEPRIVPAANGVWYAICPIRAACPYPARRYARPAADLPTRRLALELAASRPA